MGLEAFEPLTLGESHQIFMKSQVETFNLDTKAFQTLWDLHPETYHTLKIHGKEVKTPRWQQAYGQNYRYTGSQNNALAIPDTLSPFLTWSQTHIHPGLNGLLLNWYDGERKHYIGAHRDDTRDLAKGSPIVTISLGEERVFRLRPWKSSGFIDVPIPHGGVVVIPWETNLSWTHEVPYFKKYHGKRISVTLRAYWND